VLSTADEVKEKRKLAEEEMILAIERADKAHEEALIAKKEKLEAEMLAAERLSAQENAERRCEAICRERDELCEEVEILRMAEKDTVFRVKSLDRQLEVRDKEMEGLLDSAHKQRANTIQVLENLLDSERQANAEANARAEALSLQLQATQNKLDALQQELSTTRLNEVVLDGKLRIRHLKTSPGKRTRADDDIAPEESVQNVVEEENDGNPTARKKPCNSTNENGNTPSHSQCDFELLEDITPIKTPDMVI
jgi:inosine/xanthosine triphosphate pyrophosphatase family protein